MKYKGIELPDGLSEMTYNIIKSIINNFDKENKLNKLDALSLYILSGNVETYLICEKEIMKNGLVVISDRGNQALSPYAIQQKVVQSQIAVLLKELGLTLSSRNKMKLIENETKDDSPLMKLLATK